MLFVCMYSAYDSLKLSGHQRQQPQQQTLSRSRLPSFQAAPSSSLTFTLMLRKHFNPPSVASATYEESQHNISGLSSFFGNILSVLSCQQIDTPQLFLPADMQTTSRLSSNHHHLTARSSAATSPASTSSVVRRCQTAATVEHLPSL